MDINLPTVANRMADLIIDYEFKNEIREAVEDEVELEYLDDDIFYDLASTESTVVNLEDNTRQIVEHEKDLTYITDEIFISSDEEEIAPAISSPPMPKKRRINSSQLQKHLKPSKENSRSIYEKAKKKINNINSKMEKIVIAPGEEGKFHNWGEDIFLEEKCFPELYPYGYGGYLSTNMESGDAVQGFAKYIRGRIMSADPKFRQDYIYLFFLLLVKELIQLKRCKTTYLRQARKLPNLTKDDILTTDKYNFARYVHSMNKTYYYK